MRATDPKDTPSYCSLLDLQRGARAVVRGFGVEIPSDLARRLVSMGLPIGAEAEVLVRRQRGPVLLRARETRIAIGQDEARGIRVERTGTATLDTETRPLDTGAGFDAVERDSDGRAVTGIGAADRRAFDR